MTEADGVFFGIGDEVDGVVGGVEVEAEDDFAFGEVGGEVVADVFDGENVVHRAHPAETVEADGVAEEEVGVAELAVHDGDGAVRLRQAADGGIVFAFFGGEILEKCRDAGKTARGVQSAFA